MLKSSSEASPPLRSVSWRTEHSPPFLGLTNICAFALALAYSYAVRGFFQCSR